MLAELRELREHWYAVALTKDVTGEKPWRAELCGIPLVCWRPKKPPTTAGIAVFIDRCPHRGVPLSRGKVIDGHLVCPYHGWCFDPCGKLTRAPSQGPERHCPASHAAEALPTREQDGFIWVWLGSRPPTAELAPPGLGEYRRAGLHFHTRRQLFDAHYLDLVENFMDAPHTGIIHRGIIRGHRPAQCTTLHVTAEATGVTVTQIAKADEVAFGTPRRAAAAPVVHTDRFLLPNLVRVDYELGATDRRFVAFISCTPVNARQTMAFITLGIQLGKLSVLARAVIPVLATIVLRQDARIMRWQRQNLERFPARRNGFLEADIMHVKVRELSQWAMDRQTPFTSFQRQVEVYL